MEHPISKLPRVIQHMKLNSDQTIPMFQTNRPDGFKRINVYFKHNGKPVRRETWRGDGWDILNLLCRQSHMDLKYVVEAFKPQVFATHVTFWQ